jgi:hypothetical protein
MENLAENLPENNLQPVDVPMTFSALFQSMPDEYNGDYQEYLNTYGVNNTTAVELLRTSTTEFEPDRVPSVFLFQDQQRIIRTVHHLHTIKRLPGQPVGPWDNVCIGFSSDIHGGHITTLQLPAEELFTTIPLTAVPTIATMAMKLQAAENGHIRPHAHGEPDTEQISSRKMIPVPKAYVQQFLFRALDPRDAWNEIGVQIIEDGRERSCSVLLNFLRLSAVSALGNRNEPDQIGGPLVALTGMVQPPMGDASFYTHLGRKLKAILPGGTAAPTPQAVLHQVMRGQTMLQQTLYNVAEDNRVDRQREQDTVRAPKSVSEAFPAHAAKIRQICNAGNEDDRLPSFWTLWARESGKKSTGFRLLQALATERANDRESARVQPIVSATLFEQLANFQLGSIDLEDVKLGLSPFLMCPVGYRLASAQRTLNDQYVMVNDGTAPSLADTKAILPPTINVPDDIHQLVDFIGAYSVVMDVILGVAAPLSIRLREHHTFWDSQKSMVCNSMPQQSFRTVILGVLRYLQLAVLRYLNTLMYSHQAVALPNIDHLETTIDTRTYQTLPQMPAAFYLSSNAPTTKVAGGGSAAPPSRSPVQEDKNRGIPVAAPAEDIVPAWAEAYANGRKSLATLRLDGAGKLPLAAKGGHQLCLCYHLKGTCFHNCRNHLTHRKLTAAETTSFQAFVDQHL